MRKIWNIVACLAIANLLAIGGVVGWLNMTDRLSAERVRGLRETLTRTVSQEVADKAAAVGAAEQAKKAAAAADKMAQPPETAAQKIEENKIESEQQQQMQMRREREVETLRQSLAAQIVSLEQREKKLKDERAAFEAERKKLAEVEGTVQFKTALTTLEAQKPHDAKLVLGALLTAHQDEQVIAYLTRMEEGKRGKVIGEFVKDDPALAADLLERLRTHGVIAAPPGTLAANDVKPVQPGSGNQR